MTIISCLPSLPVEIFWLWIAPFQRYICGYTTTRDGPPQLAAALGSRAKRLTMLSLERAFVLARFGPLIQAAA